MMKPFIRLYYKRENTLAYRDGYALQWEGYQSISSVTSALAYSGITALKMFMVFAPMRVYRCLAAYSYI